MKKNIKDMNREELKATLSALETKQNKGKPLTALESFQLEIIPVMIEQQEKREELESKVKTTKAREVKAPEVYNILQPLFVSLRGNIGKNIVDDETIKSMFEADCKALNIENNLALQCKLWEKTTLHNSTSNIPDKKKTDSAQCANGKLMAYRAMAEQGKIMLTLISAEKWQEYDVMVNKAYLANPYVKALG